MDIRSCFFETILCAVELRHRSAAALYNAVAFAQPDGRLRILHVEQTSDQAGDAASPAARKRNLEDFVTRHIPSDVPYLPHLDFELASGNPADEILRAGSRPNADLIVVGARGHGRLQEAIVGSVAHAVLRRSEVPVMVIPPFETELVSLEASRPVFHLGRILVPVDHNRVDATQLRVAARLRSVSPEELLILHVQRPGETAVGGAQLDDIAKRHGLPAATSVRSVAARSIAQGIVDVAREEDAGLIVMGLERRQHRMEPGAISYEVIRHTTAVVLAVPPSPQAF